MLWQFLWLGGSTVDPLASEKAQAIDLSQLFSSNLRHVYCKKWYIYSSFNFINIYRHHLEIFRLFDCSNQCLLARKSDTDIGHPFRSSMLKQVSRRGKDLHAAFVPYRPLVTWQQSHGQGGAAGGGSRLVGWLIGWVWVWDGFGVLRVCLMLGICWIGLGEVLE